MHLVRNALPALVDRAELREGSWWTVVDRRASLGLGSDSPGTTAWDAKSFGDFWPTAFRRGESMTAQGSSAS